MEQGIPTPGCAAPAALRSPKRWQIAVATWAAVYPTATALLLAIGPQIADWPIPLRTLLSTAIVVPTVVYVTRPVEAYLGRVIAAWARGRISRCQ